LIAYTPIERGRLLGSPVLQQIAHKYSASPAQVAINWLVRQPGVAAIPMSLDSGHLRANLAAADIELDADDLQQLEKI
jgi:diketogulonate reductase-like aldo/keto reductase